MMRGMLSLVLIQLSLFLGLFPVQVFFFSEVSLVAPLANFLAVPVFGFIVVPAVLFAVVMIAFGVQNLAGSSLQVASWIIENVFNLVQPLAHWEF